jgi:hypothetical protein
VAAGVMAAAATAGVLVGFGVREGAPGGAFTSAGRLLLGVGATQGGRAQLAALVCGALAHVAASLAWGVLFGLVAARLRGVALFAAALVFAAAVYGVRDHAPALLRVGYGARALPPHLVLLHAVLSVGLAVGIRLAPLGGRTGATPRQRELDLLDEP